MKDETSHGVSKQGTPAISPTDHIEAHLDRLIPSETEFPFAIHKAMRHAVLRGGKRLRARLVLLVAQSAKSTPLSEAEEMLAFLAASAIEFVHAASLVHDDLPCFDNSELRRGKPTVHVVYGEPMAVLTGDALLTLAFEVLSSAPLSMMECAMRILNLLARAVGTREGMIGGQSLEVNWDMHRSHSETAAIGAESELRRESRAVAKYHHLKTGALFRVAIEAGVIAVGVVETKPWGQLGLALGHFLQLADDLIDVTASSKQALKPVRQDEMLGRPNAALLLGVQGIKVQLETLLTGLGRMIEGLAADVRPLLELLKELRAYALE